MKIDLDIVNDVTYKHVNFLYGILYIVGYTKMKKSETYSDLHVCLFCVAQSTKYLNMIFCTFPG
jgi:hypothetical protein